MKHADLILGAVLALGAASAADAAEIYTFSGEASYQANGVNTAGFYNISFKGPDAPLPPSGGYSYVYNLSGTATFTPYFPSSGNPVVSDSLIGTYTLVLRQDPSVPTYFVDLFDSSVNLLWSVTGDAGDVGLLDLTKPGSVTPTTNVIDQNFINLAGGGSAIIQVPRTYLTFSIADAASPTPEPVNWAVMLVGFGVIGTMLRATRRRAQINFA